jgi:hypothetical protein
MIQSLYGYPRGGTKLGPMSPSRPNVKRTLRAYVTQERHRDVQLAAAIAGISVSKLIDQALRTHLGAFGQEGVRRYEG